MNFHVQTAAQPNNRRSSRKLDLLVAWATGISQKHAWRTTALAVLLVGAADFLTGTRLWFGPVYLLVICLPAWLLGWRAGLAIGFACAGLSIAANGIAFYPFGEVAAAWNFGMRLLSMTMIVVLIAGLRASYDRERHRARSDPLTDVLNKNGFFEEAAARRQGGDRGILAYIDLDGLKQINDQHGHAAGDETLRRFAEGVRQNIRETDIFARIGGDEFLLFCPVADEDEGHRLASQLHARMNRIPGRLLLPIRCSMGVLVLRPDSPPLDDIDVQLADHLMYQAKQEGAALRISAASAFADHRVVKADELPLEGTPLAA